LSEDSETYSWSAIRDYHTQDNGWLDIGYHFGIEKIGDNYSYLIGRPITKQGAHCVGMNNKAIGVCFVGNYDDYQPSDQMLEEGSKYIITPLMKIFDIPTDNIVFHNEYSDKTCPGKKFSKKRLIRTINNYI